MSENSLEIEIDEVPVFNIPRNTSVRNQNNLSTTPCKTNSVIENFENNENSNKVSELILFNKQYEEEKEIAKINENFYLFTNDHVTHENLIAEKEEEKTNENYENDENYDKTKGKRKSKFYEYAIAKSDNKDSIINNNNNNDDSISKEIKITDESAKNTNYRISNIDKIEENIKKDEKEKEKEKKKKDYKKLGKFLENKIVEIVVNIVTVYALFADDFRVLVTSKPADIYFNVFTLLCLAIFTIEILLSVIAKSGYFNSFFFWLDILSTLSLIFDLTWVSTLYQTTETANTTQLARAGRASRVGTRAGRMVRLVRLVRIAKIFKKIKDTQKKKTIKEITEKEKENISLVDIHNDSMDYIPSKSDLTSMSDIKKKKFAKNSILNKMNEIKKQLQKIEDSEKNEEQETKESRVGKKLSELTTKRVIIIVLLMILILPLFSADYYFENEKSFSLDLEILVSLGGNSNINNTIKEKACNVILNNEKYINNDELLYVYVPTANCYLNKMDYQKELRKEEFEKASLSDNTGIENLIVVDFRRKNKFIALINILKTVFVTVILILGAMFFSKDANNLALRPIERMIEKVNKISKNPLSTRDEGIVNQKSTNETIIIENAITKILTLLALGFGEAGSVIIASNMEYKMGDIDPLIPGKRTSAIFGFCDIRNFTDATEVLQEEVMVFVNTIANVVHNTVDKYLGSANKNIGDAFLLVWKLPSDSLEYNSSYREHKELNKRMKGYKIKMGFGLHIGWAIEGAIGSEHKIDASYLSPNVNMAARLEAATKQYGVPLLITGSLYNNFSLPIQAICRNIDTVTVKGSNKEIKLYTVDIEQHLIQPERKSMKDFLISILNEEEFGEDFLTDISYYLYDNFDFQDVFYKGISEYYKGNWAESRKFLEEAVSIKHDEGPSKTILNYMEEFNFIAPPNWNGCRNLTEK